MRPARRELTKQLLERGERVVGTVRRLDTVAGLVEWYPDRLHPVLLDMTDTGAMRDVVDRSFATNLVGSIQVIRAALPHLRAQDGGRVVQISTYGGQVAYPGNSMQHATKQGIEGFGEA